MWIVVIAYGSAEANAFGPFKTFEQAREYAECRDEWNHPDFRCEVVNVEAINL